MDDEVRLENLDAAMTEVAAAAETWDVVVLYLSGHAKMVAVPGSPVEEWRYLTFPVHMEADDDDIARLGVSATQLVEMADRVKAQRFVVLLDTCYAGAAVDAVQALRDLRPLSADEGFVVFAGTASDTKSFEDPQIERGYFTAGLIEAINGSSQADLDGNGVVHVLGEFDSSVTGRTIRLSRQCLDAGGHEDIASQTPKFFPPRNPFPFLAVPPGEPPPPFACNER
jgi:uncharacterized caspase-like protein